MAKIIQLELWKEASQCLIDGCIVAFATDTVYGLSCRYDDKEAQQRLKNVKGRPEEKPLPLVVGSIEQCETIAILDERSRNIIKKWLPGAITLVLNKKEGIESWVNNGKDTLAIRMIDVEPITKMIQDVGVPLFLTSANLSGEPVVQDALELQAKLGNSIDLIIDGKHKEGVASTILDCTGKELVVLREGPISLEDIQKSLEG